MTQDFFGILASAKVNVPKIIFVTFGLIIFTLAFVILENLSTVQQCTGILLQNIATWVPIMPADLQAPNSS